MMSFDLTPNTGYWLGAVLTDGYFQHYKYQRRVCLKVIDREFCEAFNDTTEEMVGRRYSIIPRPAPSPRSKPQWLVQATNKRLYEWGFQETHDKTRVPTGIFKADREVQLNFLAGVMDGDGWVSIASKNQKPHYSISTFALIGVASSFRWIDDLKRLTEIMGSTTHGPTVMKRDPKYREVRQLRFKAIEFVLADVPMRIHRKRERLQGLRIHHESSEAIRSAS